MIPHIPYSRGRPNTILLSSVLHKYLPRSSIFLLPSPTPKHQPALRKNRLSTLRHGVSSNYTLHLKDHGSTLRLRLPLLFVNDDDHNQDDHNPGSDGGVWFRGGELPGGYWQEVFQPDPNGGGSSSSYHYEQSFPSSRRVMTSENTTMVRLEDNASVRGRQG